MSALWVTGALDVVKYVCLGLVSGQISLVVDALGLERSENQGDSDEAYDAHRSQWACCKHRNSSFGNISVNTAGLNWANVETND
jgi:hypothetical protein